MRTFELPAMRACVLTEDTSDHRRIFGPDGHATVYFNSPKSMLDRCRWLLQHADERRRLASAAHLIIVNGGNTYTDRLRTMLTAIRSN
jgi:spore maturation protein CgeB